MEEIHIHNTDNNNKGKNNQRFENIAWGLFLILLGIVWLFPEGILPEGTLFIGIGIILLGLNLARYMKGLKTSSFTIFLGIITLALGLGNFLGMNMPILPVVLIIWGGSILLKIFYKK